MLLFWRPDVSTYRAYLVQKAKPGVWRVCALLCAQTPLATATRTHTHTHTLKSQQQTKASKQQQQQQHCTACVLPATGVKANPSAMASLLPNIKDQRKVKAKDKARSLRGQLRRRQETPAATHPQQHTLAWGQPQRASTASLLWFAACRVWL
jgi:hypothetical protein